MEDKKKPNIISVKVDSGSKGINMYQQIQNILDKVARGTETSLFAISSARKSLSNIKENPKSLSEDVEDVLQDIIKAEEMINELEGFLGEWIKKYELEDALKVPI